MDALRALTPTSDTPNENFAANDNTAVAKHSMIVERGSADCDHFGDEITLPAIPAAILAAARAMMSQVF